MTKAQLLETFTQMSVADLTDPQADIRVSLIEKVKAYPLAEDLPFKKGVFADLMLAASGEAVRAFKDSVEAATVEMCKPLLENL